MYEVVFSGVREKWLPLFLELRRRSVEVLPKFSEVENTNAILWRHNTSFAEIKARRDGIIIGISSDVLREDWDAFKTIQTSKKRVGHYILVDEQTDLDELTKRILSAYELTDTGRVVNRTPKADYTTVDEYINGYSGEIKNILEEIRNTINDSIPEASEKISWGMPTFYFHENVIHFAAAKNHVSIFPTPDAIIAFADRLNDYTTTKGGIQFPYSSEIDYELIGDIAKWRMERVREKFGI